MKSMVLTGLGSEQDFGTGGTGYFLIFNNGELRVPISEVAAETVIKEMYSENPVLSTEQKQPSSQHEERHSSDDVDYDYDGVGQV